MSNAKYIFDTNVFINMQRHHPADIFGSLWNQIATYIDSGVVLSSEEVFDELKICNDSLLEWAKSRKEAFVKSDEQIQLLVRDILKKQPSLITGSRKANGADPFVVALAKISSCTLVTDETKSGAGQPVKIPNVCEEFGVRQIKFVEFLREMKIAV